MTVRPPEKIDKKTTYTVGEVSYLTASRGLYGYIKTGSVACSYDIRGDKYFTLIQVLNTFLFIDLYRVGVHKYKTEILMHKLREIEKITKYPSSIVAFFFMSPKTINHSILVAYEQEVETINQVGIRAFLQDKHPEYLSQIKPEIVKLGGYFVFNTQDYMNRIRTWPQRLSNVNLPKFPKLNII